MTLTDEQIADLRAKAEAAKLPDMFVGGPFPQITICVDLEPPYWNPACPESYDPGHCEQLFEYWPGKSGEAPAEVKAQAEFIVAACNALPGLLDEVKGWREAAKLWSIERRRNTEVDAEMQAEIDQLRRERDGVIERCAMVAEKRMELCRELRVTPGDLSRNYYGGGMSASEEIAIAIRSLTLPEPAEGAT